MTSVWLIPDLQADEGFRAHAYPDPLTGGEPWTVGYGATGPEIGPDTVWTKEQALADLKARTGLINSQLMQYLPWWHSLSDLRQDVFVNMAYNLGVHGLLGFHTTLTLSQEGKFQAASEALLLSRAATQLPRRYDRLATQLRTNARVPA